DGDFNNVKEWHVTDLGSKAGRCVTAGLDRNVVWSTWMPDGKSLLVGGHDHTRVSLWQQPLDGPARKLALGCVLPAQAFGIDAHVGRQGAIAFTVTEAQRPSELYYLASADAAPRRLTNFNQKFTGLVLGKVEAFTWKTSDGFAADGVLVF